MKKLLAFMAALSLGFSCFSATAFAAASTPITAEFRVYNNTGSPVVDVFMAESGANSWGNDLIDQTSWTRMFDTRYINVQITFDPNKTYDFFVRHKDGAEEEMTGLSLVDGTEEGGTIRLRKNEVVFIPAGVADPYAPKEGYHLRLFNIYNNTGKPITEVYVSEAGADKWSNNLMEQGGFNRALDGQFLEVQFEITQDKTYDLFIRSEDGSEDIASGLTLGDMYSKGGNVHIRKDDVVLIPADETDPYIK